MITLSEEGVLGAEMGWKLGLLHRLAECESKEVFSKKMERTLP